MSGNRLYRFMYLALFAGYLWVGWNLVHPPSGNSFTPCPLKNLTGIACPSCGTTRSVIAVANGNLQQAAFINPLGIVASIIMVVLPFWIAYDLLLKKDTLQRGYNKTEDFLRNRIVIAIAALLMITNWIWNIYKGL